MKKTYTVMLGAAITAAAIAAGSWATAAQRHSKLEATLLPRPAAGNVFSSHSRMGATRAQNASYYWTVAQSCYNNGGLDLENGDIRQYGTRIEFDGDKVTIWGLVDLYYDTVLEEFPIEGTYDERKNTITVDCLQYDPTTPVSDYVQLANMKSDADGKEYTAVLFAGDMNGQQLSTVDKLVFKVSDDLSTIEAQSGFGAYAFDEDDAPMAFYDYYQPGVRMTLATPDDGVEASVGALDFNGFYVFKSVEVKQTISLYNKSSAEAPFTIETSSPELSVSETEGTLEPCSSRDIIVTLKPNSTGIFDGSVTISSPVIATPIVINVNVQVSDYPDYAKITCANSEPMTYGMSSLYPFVISEFDGHVVAESTNNGAGGNTQSYFVCFVNVPKGKTGIFSWKAMQINRQPNSLVVFVDNNPVKYDYYSQSDAPFDMSGCAVIEEGQHEIAFNNQLALDWTEYGHESHSYVWDVDLQYVEAKDNLGYVGDSNVDFGTTYFDKLAVDITADAVIINAGNQPLKVLSVSGDGNFSGTVPTISVDLGNELHVPLTWHTTGVGEDTGDVTISTTGGDFTFHCKGSAEALPYDYSNLVEKGEFSFNTDIKWPFMMSDNGKYAYNTTSKADVEGITYSWLDASFEVPAGQVGLLNWEALNSSEDLFWFQDTPSLISGTIFTLDGENEMMVGGVDIDCNSSDIYTPNLLTFKEGRHTVRFNYKKTSNDASYVKGDDRLKLYILGVEYKNIDEYKSALSATSFNFSKPIYIGCTGHLAATLYNYTTETPALLSYECDGPFKAVSTGIDNGNLNLMIEFTPETAGDAAAEMLIKTNIGDFTVSCTGNAEESSIGKAIYYESFEYDFFNHWIISDANNDGNTWTSSNTHVAMLQQIKVDNYEGSNGLVIFGYNPDIFDYYDVDDYAITPEIEIPADGTNTLRFMLCNPNYMEPNVKVLAGEGDDISSYQIVETLTPESPSTWQPVLVDLSAYAGKKIRIAIYASDVNTMLMIDDVLVATTGTTVGITELNGEAVETYYSIDGLRLSEAANGLNIVVTRHPDGTVTTSRKMMRR